MTDASQGSPAVPGFIPATSAASPPQPASDTPGTHSHAIPANQLFDQLARIEDKCSRIEDKYARSEALLSRVEDKVDGAAGRMNEAARQSDLAALRTEMRGLSERTRRLPGTGALILTALVTAILTVALTIAAQRLNLDSLLPPKAGGTTVR